MDHPDELRIDLDPVPGVGMAADRRRRACRARGARRGRPRRMAEDQRLARRAHVGADRPRWTFAEVRRAALAFAREVERRAPAIATAKWWKEERRGVFLDYNQNARDRTTASAYSVRAAPDARVSMPLSWDDVLRLRSRGVTRCARCPRWSRRAAMRTRRSTTRRARSTRCSSSPRGRKRTGRPDAPWPPHFAKRRGRGAARGAIACTHRTAAGAEAAGDHDRAGEDQGRRARRSRAVEGAPPGGRGEARARGRARRHQSRPRRPRGTACGSTSRTSPRTSGPPRSPRIPTTTGRPRTPAGDHPWWVKISLISCGGVSSS